MSRNISLTPIDKIVWRVIEEYIHDNGYPPSMREIMKVGNVSSTSVVSYSISKLVSQGIISKTNGKSRSTTVLISCQDNNNKSVKQKRIDLSCRVRWYVIKKQVVTGRYHDRHA